MRSVRKPVDYKLEYPIEDQRVLCPAVVAEMERRVAMLEAKSREWLAAKDAPDPVPPAEGLRTERVTLEITHGINSRPVELATWVRSAVSWKLHTGESVRVVDEAASATDRHRWDRDGERCVKCRDKDWMGGPCNTSDDEHITNLTAERDAAIREREELRNKLNRCPECNGEGKHDSGGTDASGEWINLPCEGCSSTGTIHGYIEATDKLRARVAELETAPAASGAAVGTCNTFCGERECERTDPTQCKRGEPQPARGGLTTEEREASTEAMKCMTKLRRERDAAIRERDAAQSQCEELERAALVDHQTIGKLLARVAELEAERDAAKEECGRLRHLLKTKESECETHHPWVHPSAAPAGTAGGDDAVVVPQTVVAGNFAQIHWNTCCRLHRMAMDKAGVRWTQSTEPSRPESEEAGNAGGEQELPRGWLTAEERAAVEMFIRMGEEHDDVDAECRAASLRTLLARSTPPMVRKVNCIFAEETRDWRAWILAETKWIAAIRAAGGEVADE